MLVNGQTRNELIGKSIDDLLDFFSLSRDRVVVEYNGKILDLPTDYSIITQTSDSIEIIGLVGGG